MFGKYARSAEYECVLPVSSYCRTFHAQGDSIWISGLLIILQNVLLTLLFYETQLEAEGVCLAQENWAEAWFLTRYLWRGSHLWQPFGHT